MSKWKSGKLRSGPKVNSRKQAIAIKRKNALGKK